VGALDLKLPVGPVDRAIHSWRAREQRILALSFEIVELRDKPEALPFLAQMLYAEFWSDVSGVSPDTLAPCSSLGMISG
jgi:hypothetical protein